MTHYLTGDLLPLCGDTDRGPDGTRLWTPMAADVTCPSCCVTIASRSIEQAAAWQTVADYGVDAVWIAPTPYGATLRASLCLAAGADPQAVSDALGRWTP